MKIDLSCPVEVWEAACPVPEREACTLKLFNLTDKTVNSVEISIIVTDRNGRELQHIIHRCYSLHGRPRSVFEAAVAMSYDSGAAAAEASAVKVWFDDNTVWRKSRDPLTEYTSNTLPPCRDLDMLRYVAGPTAVGFPEEQENVWLCICGRANGKEEPICARCRQTKERVFETWNRENIRDLYERKERRLALKSRAVREENARLQLEREEAYNQKTAKETGDRRLLTGLAIAVVFTLLLFFAGIPALRYATALYGMDHGRADEAEQILTELGGFPGAAGQLTRCRYLRAEQSLGSGDAVLLAKAADIFRADGGEEAAELARSADYERASLLMDNGDPAQALALFTSLEDYRDSPDLATECAYRVALGHFDSRFFGMALEEFTALGEYRDSAEKRDLCIYLPAAEYMENGEYDAAIAEYGKIPDYGDSREQIKICQWLKGVSLEESDPALAAEAYAQADDYMDGKGKARVLRYALAGEAEAAGDFASAAELYALAVPYEDSLNREYTCIYTMAEQFMTDGRYEAARALYITLPDGYRDSEERLYSTRYLPASAAQKESDWETAISLYSEIPEYKDSASRLEKCRYELARSLQSGEDYIGAIAQYSLLGSYADSEKQLNNSRYSLAVKYAAEGKTAEAAELFTVLGNYKDSSTRLKELQAANGTGTETANPEAVEPEPSDFAVEDEQAEDE